MSVLLVMCLLFVETEKEMGREQVQLPARVVDPGG